MTIEFNVGDEVWYGAWCNPSKSVIHTITVTRDGVKYGIANTRDPHEKVYKTERELVISSLKEDIASHERYAAELKEKLLKWENEK